jgi:L-glutamine-phosphate cytidylyltransferase
MYVAALMAGSSSRLLPLTKANHKALLRVGTRPIIDIQMRIFALAGIQTFSFVVGHGGRRLADHLLRHYSATEMSIINNPYYAERNLDWSAYLALSSRADDVIYYEGDIIVSPELISRVSMHKGDICVAMDSMPKSARVDTKVRGDRGRARELVFSEHGDLSISTDGSEGEFICMVKLSNRARAHVLARLRKGTYTGPMTLYRIFSGLFRHYPSYIVNAAGTPWVEIDNKQDLLRARNVVKQLLNGG